MLAISVATFTTKAQDNLVNSVKNNQSADSKSGFTFTTVIDLANTSIKNQGSSGTCWSYSTNSFLESEMIREGKKPLDLSQIYSARCAYIENNDFKLLRIVSEAVRQMSEGELLQIEKVRRMDIDEPIYYEVIRQKTASLIASCCACGAASAGASDEVIEKMRLFGEKIGIAFQIKDDMFDFGTDDVGKPLGIDIKEKKVTLPLIYSLSTCSKADKKRMINLVKNHNDEAEKIGQIIKFVKDTGGLEYAETQMKKYQDEAFEILNTFPEGESRLGLEQLVRFTTERNK